jgi:hypothetical protein
VNSFTEKFQAARVVSTPLIAIQTPDAAGTIATLCKLEPKDARVASWDIVRGVVPGSKSFRAELEVVNSGLETLTNPAEALSFAAQIPAQDMLFFVHNAHLYAKSQNADVVQAIWNLRDVFKRTGSTLVLLCPEIQLPAELQDVLVLDEPLPTKEELGKIVLECVDSAKNLKIDNVKANGEVQKCAEALSGLSSFVAEQSTMMMLSVARKISVPELWERKRKAIEQIPGLTVNRSGETFDDIRGVENAKKFFRAVINGNEPPNVVLFFDEIEKALAGATGGDLSGTSQEMLGALLTWMQERAVTGTIALGPPGCAKSMIAKATGNTAGIPTIQFDLSGMKGSLVGESGRNLRQAFKVVDAVSGDRVLCIATCNAIAKLPPELRRRFAFGTFFFDLPTAEERAAIWELYLKKYNLNSDPCDDDMGWTGAEIQQCCNIAFRLKISVAEAATYIVPVSRSAAEDIENLRTQANGRFISASAPGVYVKEPIEAATSTLRRKVKVV